MKCPHCSSEIAPAALRCSGCHLSLDSLRTLMGSDWVRLERITDNYTCVPLTQFRHMEAILDEFERQFPQCFFAAYFGPIPGGLTSLDLGFWLLNYGAFNTHQLAKRNDFGIMCIIDPATGSASLSIGYGLEPALSAEVLDRVLQKMQPLLKKADYARTIETAVKHCRAALLKLATASSLRPESADCGPNPEDLGFEPLRSRHSHSSASPAPAQKIER